MTVAQAEPRTKTVIIIDDDDLFSTSIAAPLRRAGYVVQSFDHAPVNLIDVIGACDLLILDLALPERNGFDILAEIRNHPQTINLPVLMLTAHDEVRFRVRGFELGAEDYMGKPPNHQELVLRVASLLKRSGKSAGPVPKVAVQQRCGHLLIGADQIAYVRAFGNYSELHLDGSIRLSNNGISKLAETLSPTLVRCHRSYLVNPAFVAGTRWLNSSEYVLELCTPTAAQIPVSRAYRAQVRGALALDI